MYMELPPSRNRWATDCFEQNEECSQGLDTSDEASCVSDIDDDDDYWTFIENPTPYHLIITF